MAALGVVAAVVVTGSILGRDYSIKGTLTLIDAEGRGSSEIPGNGCEGPGGYDDIHSATQVTVRDESGELLATSDLGSGTDIGMMCEFEFAIEDVPKADFYEIEVASRGVSYSFKELSDDEEWIVAFTLGDF